jgi:predicted TIM-barrel fold metal-dependent hydrolase
LRTSTGLGVVAGVSGPATSSAPARQEPAEAARRDEPGFLRSVDTHVHVAHSRVTGMAEHEAPAEAGDPLDLPVAERAGVIAKELRSAGIEHALCMPSGASATDPLGIRETREIADRVPGLHPIGIADPRKTDAEHLDRVEAALRAGAVKGFKAYLGYLHYGPDHPGYGPYYELAARYKLPFILHTGDTYSYRAKLKYAHPLLVDEVAVDHPGVRFVMAHMGNPWLPDTAEVLYKNNKPERANVWTDLSGFVVGTDEDMRAYREQGVLAGIAADIRKAFAYAERPRRFLYGSDWPLVPMEPYHAFMREVIPERHHEAVFRDNAKELFAL